MHTFKKINAAMSAHNGSMDSLVKKLENNDLTFLSYSKISSLEFCPYRYFLEYVQRVNLIPEPESFIKGRLFHQAAANAYSLIAQGKTVGEEHIDLIQKGCECSFVNLHIENAIKIMLANILDDWEVIGVEKPFVLYLGRNLPPCVGVIDLILRKGNVITVIDHKTGKNFWSQDPMQLAVYRQYVMKNYKAEDYLTFYDEYRWVENLKRIRKPAFQQTQVCIEPKDWSTSMERFRIGYKLIKRIETEGDAAGSGKCYMCLYKGQCNKVRSAFY